MARTDLEGQDILLYVNDVELFGSWSVIFWENSIFAYIVYTMNDRQKKNI